MHIKSALLAAAAAVAVPLAASAAPLFTDNFDVDSTANWAWNSEAPADAANDNTGNEYNGFFDYSTVGIPSAPNSVGGSTRGLKLEANVAGARFTGSSASPVGQVFPSDYILRFDAWQNFNGPLGAGGSGSTQVTWAGIGTNGTTAQFPGTSVQGVGVGATGDGGSGDDYRIYTNVGAPVAIASGAYAAGVDTTARNNTDSYYADAGFGGESAPAAQLALFPQQTETTAVGTQGMAWHEWEIIKEGNQVSWSIDGVPIGSLDISAELPFGGDNIFLGYFDVNATSSADANRESLLFGLFDNVQVDMIPEPASLSLLGLGGLALLRRRRTA